ncbi:ubinuclein-2b isoform 2-T2 [Pholidichthys leucotaenia]
MAQKGVQLHPENFSCPICLDLLEDPVSLHCGHSYCMDCIKVHWDAEDMRGTYSCPQCRKTFIPRPDVVKNTVLAGLVEELKKTGLQAAPADHCYAGPADVACDFCSGRKLKAVRTCLDCRASSCQDHLQPHYDVVPLRKHKLVEPSKNLQENICSRHDEVMKIFCRTDQQSICYLCTMDEHKGHNIVSVAAERAERQKKLSESRLKIQQRIQGREKDVKVLQQQVEAINGSADKTVEDSEKMFTELIRLIQKRSSDVKQQVRSQQQTEVSRVLDLQQKLEQEIAELKSKDGELERLSHTEDPIQFLHSYPSLSALRESPHSSIIYVGPLSYFEEVTAAVSEVRDKLQDILTETWTNISELLLTTEPKTREEFLQYSQEITLDPNTVKPAASTVPKGLTPPLDPSDPFADDEKERREVEELARKFESKYGGGPKKKKKDRMQDLIDIGYGYDETDPFIDNSEAYDELVPASLTTKHGGFYINTGTLQFRPTSDSEAENAGTDDNHFKKMKDGEERVIKKRRKKQDGGILEEKKPRKNKVPKPGVSALNIHRPEKKKRKKLMKDSLHLANMLRRFTREKEEMRKKNLAATSLQRPKVPNTNSALLNTHPKAPSSNECNMADLTEDPTVMSLLGSANNDMLQDMMGDLDFGMLDSPQPSSPAQGENGSFGMGHRTGGNRVPQGNVMTPPPLPEGLPEPLAKRIEDLRVASRLFDEEGRKKFFTLDMNNILLDIELQVQEQPAVVRSAVYSHLEAFVPCNKEALLKRLKKLSLNIQDDRIRTPLLKLKLAVCSVMPEQIARYNMDCIAKVAKQQSEEGEKNGSEDDDEEKPGKRVMGPRKKFVWDDKLRSLLCNLVRVKLNCYELEGKNSPLEEYLKTFMETEVKPLWPKGWMQARMLFKESIMVHGHLTGYTAKKKMVATPKAKPKEDLWVQRSTPSAVATPSPAAQVTKRPPHSPSEPICLDSLDEAPSLDSISQALAILGNAAKGLAQGDSPPSPEEPKTATKPSSLHASPLLQPQKKNSVSTPSSKAPHYISTSSCSSSPLSRSSSITSASLPSVRVDGMGVVKSTVQAHRHSVLNTQRTLGVGVTKANMAASVSPPKPRPPPTASPLVAPGSKTGVSTPPSGLLKVSNNNKANSGNTLIITSPQPRPHTLSSPSLTASKTFQTARTPQTPQSKSNPSLSQSLQPQPQSNFITPMHATLTKSTHSSIPPIVKLTPRTPNPVVTTGSSAPSSVSQSSRSQASPAIHQYPNKSPAGFRPPFSGAQGGAAKPGQGSYTPPNSQKSNNSTTNTSLINTSSISKHSGSSASPTVTSATQSQRQRSGGGTPQGAKPVTSVPLSSVPSQLTQVSAAGSGSLLSSASSLSLGYGMIGGLVPVSLPFQYPQLLNLPSMGTGGSAKAASSSAASSTAPFSTLTQNLFKSLQSGSQVALPPHLQLAFSDVSQNQGGDAKRKTL